MKALTMFIRFADIKMMKVVLALILAWTLSSPSFNDSQDTGIRLEGTMNATQFLSNAGGGEGSEDDLPRGSECPCEERHDTEEKGLVESDSAKHSFVIVYPLIDDTVSPKEHVRNFEKPPIG